MKRPAKTSFKLPRTVSRRALLDADGEETRFRQLTYDLVTVAGHLETLRSYLGSCMGLTGPQYSIVMCVAEHQHADGIAVGAVAKHLHVSGAFVTGEVWKLEAGGILAKRANPADRRSVLLTLAPKGMQAVRDVGTRLRSVNDHFFAGLSASDFGSLCRIAAGMSESASRTVQGILNSEVAS